MARGFSRRLAMKASTGSQRLKDPNAFLFLSERTRLFCAPVRIPIIIASCTSFVAPIRALGGFKHPSKKFATKSGEGHISPESCLAQFLVAQLPTTGIAADFSCPCKG